MMQKIIINLPFRIHMNLHAMHECPYRKNGGIGFSVSSKCTLLAQKNTDMKISVDGICTDNSKVNFIEEKLNNIKIEYKLKNSIRIDVRGDLLFHCGLGVGTAITLASIESLFLVNGEKISEEKIQELSGRGGTSGIGVYTYFEGGIIIDAGVHQNGEQHTPSSYQKSTKAALKLLRAPMPNWNCLFAIPQGGEHIFGNEEKMFFDKNTPIEANSAFEATYLSFMGIIPSIFENNYEKFKTAVFAIQDTNWKKLEIFNSNKKVSQLIDLGKEFGVACGMSSLGAGVYFVSDKPLENFLNELKMRGFDAFNLELSNTGRVIRHV